MKIIPFGSLVRDKITEFKGIVIYRIEHMNDCIRYGVQPVVGSGGKLLENKVFDGPNLEITAPPKSDLLLAVETTNTFELGVKLKDCVTGFKGIAVLRIKQRHSGDRYGIQQPMDKKGEIPDIQMFDEEDLEQIDPPVKKKKKETKKPPNGPHDHNNAIAR